LLVLSGLLPLGDSRGEADPVRRGRPLVFPRDHGAHLGSGIEWWYVTGWFGSPEQPRYGFQVTFFRHRTGLAQQLPGRFAARQLLFAHAALTDVERKTHQHGQRVVRWSGAGDAVTGAASERDTDVRIGEWFLRRAGAGLETRVGGEGFGLDARFEPTQPLLLQGEAGFSRKGPLEQHASHYYSVPQLAVRATLTHQGRRSTLAGRAWMDHEWSDEYLATDAVGWDWIGFNLFDGSALTAFRLRRRDGSALWAGGSWRAPRGQALAFEPHEVEFVPGRIWVSPVTRARYPLAWQVRVPQGRFEVHALADSQELDSRPSTGTLYWEGLAELRDETKRRVGLGYLELTGYIERVRLQ
jgi:predicted secreted hydrolase